jgi:Metal binding domain of Ada
MAGLGLLTAAAVHGWDYVGHRLVNQLALDSLPADFPAFVREPANIERINYLANLPDRWRNVDPWLKQSGSSWTDHFCDLEQLADAGLDVRTVPSLRLDFAVAFAAGRTAHADRFPPIDPARNIDHTREWPGFAPWAITEWVQKLRSAFGYLKAYQEARGTPQEIANAQADAVYAMGVLGHYVADGAQPLHTTIHHNGWVGANPNGYTTWPGFHSWIDSGFIAKAEIKAADLGPRQEALEPIACGARADGRDPVFIAAMDYLLAQHQLVEPLYRLEKEGTLNDEQEKADRSNPTRLYPGPVSAEGRAFIVRQLGTGGQMLGRLWLTAWKTAPADTYLMTQLLKRPEAPPATAQPLIEPAGPFCGSAQSTIYHQPGCQWAKKIKASNRIEFKTKADAVQRGYEPCRECKP